MTTYLELVAEKATGRVTDAIRREIGDLVGDDGLIFAPARLRTYECDGLTGSRVVPALVVLPEATAEVAAVVRVCSREGIPFVARGAGTGRSGGALPVADGIVIGLQRMRRILSVDPPASSPPRSRCSTRSRSRRVNGRYWPATPWTHPMSMRRSAESTLFLPGKCRRARPSRTTYIGLRHVLTGALHRAEIAVRRSTPMVDGGEELSGSRYSKGD